MKQRLSSRIGCGLLFLCLNSCPIALFSTTPDTLSFEQIAVELSLENARGASVFLKKHRDLKANLHAVEAEIANTAGRRQRRYREALEHKIALMDDLSALEAQESAHLLTLRYRKGIDLIKLLYEKILGLDHHFSSLHTYQNISALSNPHSYPEFQKTKELLERKMDRRFAMRLPNMLESNPFISATFTLVTALLGDSGRKEKEEDFEKIACILDFTLRMNADLGAIRHETGFLKTANQQLLQDCERLFADYAKAVGYLVPLATCRQNDDWESLYEKLDALSEEMEAEAEDEPEPGTRRDLVNLEFATQRVADFIGKYSEFIAEGSRYYRKFDSIVSTYQHESACESQLPRQFDELKKDIEGTIEKFDKTYHLPELQGSRLKSLMYGMTD